MIEFITLLILFQVRHAIIIAYLHRDLCHRSVIYSPAFAQFTRILQWMGSHNTFDLQYNADWAFTHRSHHKYADTHQDPYYPIMENRCDPDRYAAMPIDKTKIDRWLEAHPYGFITTLLCFGFFYEFVGILFAVAILISPRWRMIWANYVYHAWPGHAWETGEQRSNARNLYWGPLIFMGEELHANHHQWAGRANFGIKWWEIDLSYWLLRLLSFVGLTTIAKNSKVDTENLTLTRVR